MTAPTQAQAARCGIAIMAKASEPGRTKTRLVPPLSFEEAARFNTAFIRDVASNILAAAERASVAPYVAFGPPGADGFFADILPAAVGAFPASYPDFGDCLFNALDELLGRGHAAAIVLNADGPNLPTSLLVEAAAALERPGERAVLGPSEDGGYYLLGVKAAHRRLFEAIDWSTERVARQTLARAQEIGLPVHVLPSWYDVDDPASLTRLMADLLGGARPGAQTIPFGAPHTRALLTTLIADADALRRLDWSPQRARAAP